MNKLKLTVKKFYICLTILCAGSHAFCEEPHSIPLTNPQSKLTTPSDLGLQETSQQFSTFAKNPELIFKNKDLFENKEILKQNLSVMGPRTGGGGNSCSLAVSQNTEKLMELMKLDKYSKIVNFSKVLPVIKDARFYLQDRLEKDGQTKDAMNFPAEEKILFTPHFCATELLEVSGRSMSLLLHEYLGLARIDDSKYQISGKFLTLYSADAADNVQARAYLESELKKEMQGQKSCLAGAVRAKVTEMATDNQGEISDKHDMGVEAQTVNFGSPMNRADNCDTFLDKAGHITTDVKSAVYKVCTSFDTIDYVATIRLPSFVRRGVGKEGLIFKVSETRKITMVLDKNIDFTTEDDGVAKKYTVSSSFACTPIPF